MNEKSIITDVISGESLGIGYTDKGLALCRFKQYQLLTFYFDMQLSKATLQFNCITTLGTTIGCVLVRIDESGYSEDFKNKMRGCLYNEADYKQTLSRASQELRWRWLLLAYKHSKYLWLEHVFNGIQDYDFTVDEKSIICFAGSKANRTRLATIDRNGAVDGKEEYFAWCTFEEM